MTLLPLLGSRATTSARRAMRCEIDSVLMLAAAGGAGGAGASGSRAGERSGGSGSSVRASARTGPDSTL